LIDDATGHTLAAASSVSPSIRGEVVSGANVAAAEVVGRVIGERAVEAGVRKGVLDRGGYQYHGRVRALAEAARQAGLDLGPSREPKNKGRKEVADDKEQKNKGGKGKKGKKKQSD
jgi:large subunit ribosomal protein L18